MQGVARQAIREYVENHRKGGLFPPAQMSQL